MKPESGTPNNADEYVASQPEEYREILEELRNLVKNVLPEAEEVISYKIITYKYLYSLVGIGTKKGFCSFYTMNPDLMKKIKGRLKDVKYAGSTLHFPLGEPLPEDLIKDIVAMRIKENVEKALGKRKK